MSLRVAVVGSGPSAFYAAARLLGSSANVQVDMYERLPTPHGLVRWGVAPDHPDVKVSPARDGCGGGQETLMRKGRT
jgi:NADPH-dependent glutamate synthase beta subunit-like oxidoreductase